jgi:branched-chain amino acid transport system substrate-binding protein
VKNCLRIVAGAAIVSVMILPAKAADITVGLITSMTGPGASIGIPYSKGSLAGVAYKDEVAGIKLKLIQLDDASDPSIGTRDARKLIEQDKVDVLMGAGSTPTSIAMTAVCHELKVPCITLAPVNMPGEPGSWMVSIPQPPTLMVSAVVDYMKAAGVKTVGYIGFSDGWGDLVYGGLEKSAEPDGIKILTNERYARADTSVTAQALHIISAEPDAVMTGGSGTPGALPFIALRERGYTKEIYGTPALINPDFVRVGGAAVEGVIASTGPVVIADQLPDSYPTKKILIRRPTTSRRAAPSAPMRSMVGWCCSIRRSTLWRPGRHPAHRNSAQRCVTHSSTPRMWSAPTAFITSIRAIASASIGARLCWSSSSTASGSWCSNRTRLLHDQRDQSPFGLVKNSSMISGGALT